MDGVSPMTFFATPSSFLIVIFSAIGATFFSGTMSDMKAFPKVFLKAIKGQKLRETPELIDQVVSFAEQARREGLLALEEQVHALHRRVGELEALLQAEREQRPGSRVFAAAATGSVVTLRAGMRVRRQTDVMLWRPELLQAEPAAADDEHARD